MATQSAASHNPGVRSSGKVSTAPRRRNLALAAQVAHQVGMVDTWPNVQTIRLALEAEARYSDVTLDQAAALIVTAAFERSTLSSSYVCASEWEKRECARENRIDRFWFEDARWRTKYSYCNLLEKLKSGAA